jgi:release factor glutamine methyltransferase
MTIKTLLAQATARLEQAGIGTARLDVLVLLENVSGKSRAWLLAHPEFKLSSAQVKQLTNLFNRRAKHEPLAYIRERGEFYGREFVLTPAVLQPRPESETMIDLLKKLPLKSTQPYIADIGSGSGALGITAKLELPDARVDLIEIDPQAAKIAQTNVDKFTLDLTVIRSDLLDQATSDYDILLCNLPYVPDDFQINLSAGHEPQLAIFGGSDGLDVYRRLFKQLGKRTSKPLYILCESLPSQHAELTVIAKLADYTMVKDEDFIQQYEYRK